MDQKIDFSDLTMVFVKGFAKWAKAIKRAGVNLDKWEKFRIRFWLKLGKTVRAQRIISAHLDKEVQRWLK